MVKEKNNIYLIDSNVWIGFYNEEDSSHAAAVKIIKELEKNQKNICITNFNIQEVFTILSLYTNLKKALEFYNDTIIEHNLFKQEMLQLDITKDFMDDIVAFIKKHSTSSQASFVDYSLLYLCLEFNLELITFDKKLMNFYERLKKQKL